MVIGYSEKEIDEVLSVILKFAADALKRREAEFTKVSSVLRNDDRYWSFKKKIALEHLMEPIFQFSLLVEMQKHK